MKKIELQKQSEKIISQINKVTNMDFKICKIDVQTQYLFDDNENDNDNSDVIDNITYYWLGECKSHKFGIHYYPNKSYDNYFVWFEKINGEWFYVQSLSGRKKSTLHPARIKKDSPTAYQKN